VHLAGQILVWQEAFSPVLILPIADITVGLIITTVSFHVS
jgi:hypothetical protein